MNRKKKFEPISDEEMRQLDEDPRVPFGRGLIDGMIFSEIKNKEMNQMFGDSIFGDADSIPEKWTSEKRGKRLKKNTKKFKKFKVL